MFCGGDAAALVGVVVAAGGLLPVFVGVAGVPPVDAGETPPPGLEAPEDGDAAPDAPTVLVLRIEVIVTVDFPEQLGLATEMGT